MSSPRSEFAAGAKDVLPGMVGLVVFAMITGVTLVDAGIAPALVVAMSIIVFAGAAQLAVIQLLETGTPVIVLLATTAIINLRLMMYSASLAPHFRSVSRRWRGLLGLLVNDFAFALSMTRFSNQMKGVCKRWYYLGAAIPVWLTWQAGTVVGAFLGARIPEGISLEFIIPLTFLALLFPAIENRAGGTAALLAGISAVLLAALPFNAGLVIATFIGIFAGVLMDRRSSS